MVEHDAESAQRSAIEYHAGLIRIENEQFKWAGESDDAGDFTAAVPPGTYRIYAEAHGFRRFESLFSTQNRM